MLLIENMIFIQALGFIAFILGVSSFLQKDDRKLKLLLAAQCLFLTIHFYLLDAQGGAAMVFIGMIRNLMAASGKNLKPFAWLFMGAFLVAGIIRYEEWVDALPVSSSVVGSYGIFYLKDIPMRLCFVFGSSMWLTHNILVGSVGPALMEAVMLGATLKTIYHLHRDKKETA